MHSLFDTDKPIDKSFIATEIERFWTEKKYAQLAIDLFLLLQQKLEEGSVCVNLKEAIQYASNAPEGTIVTRPFLSENELDAIKKLELVGGEDAFTPLILSSNHCLYFHKYWKYETELLGYLKEREQRTNQQKIQDAGSSTQNLLTEGRISEEQLLGVFTALRNSMTLITGGPGTGKTTVVARILASYFVKTGEKPFRVALAAPTGKAAVRMRESLENECKSLRSVVPNDFNMDAFLNAIPKDSFTLHRLLSYSPSENAFRKNAKNPLNYDLIILDEATMIELPLMVHFFRALPKSSNVVLLGDRDQLTSVGAGSIFADLISRYETGAYPKALIESFEAAVAGSSEVIKFPESNKGSQGDNLYRSWITRLTCSYRFNQKSGIAAVCAAVREGSYSKLLECFQINSGYTDFIKKPFPKKEKDFIEPLYQELKEHYEVLANLNDPKVALTKLKEVCVLSPIKNGLGGVESINSYFKRKFSGSNKNELFSGLPILIEVNDYGVGLFNGDIGIILNENTSNKIKSELVAYFPDVSGTPKRVAINSLPPYKPAYSMTIHKSQGSEFDHAIVVIPSDSTVLCREIIYTAISRGKIKATLIADDAVLEIGLFKKQPEPQEYDLHCKNWTTESS